MLATLEEIVKEYYSKNQSCLVSHYPGLPLRRLMEEAISYLQLKKNLISEPKTFLSKSYLDDFFTELEQGKPLEYITGRSYFFDSYFCVNKHVLIPRSETEVLVDYILKYLDGRKEKLSLVDIGTGSGNIIITLAQKLIGDHQLTGIDFSKKALEVARLNSFLLDYSISANKTLNFLYSDLLEEFSGDADLIVSNPPYYKTHEDISLIHEQVQSFEPASAVFIDDGLFESWYHRFFKQCWETLSGRGDLVIETDSKYISLLESMAIKEGFTLIKRFSDLAGFERFLHLKKEY